MAVFHIILRDLSFVDFLLFGKEINGKTLLKKRRPHIFFIGQSCDFCAVEAGDMPDNLRKAAVDRFAGAVDEKISFSVHKPLCFGVIGQTEPERQSLRLCVSA